MSITCAELSKNNLKLTPPNSLPVLKGSISTEPSLKGSLTDVPKILEVNCLTSNSLTCNSRQIINCNKLDKYRFPTNDFKDPNSDETYFSKIQTLGNILNLSVCRLNTENYKFWSKLAKRHVNYKEISKIGIQSTKFDIKMEIARYKKEQEKKDYIGKLKINKKILNAVY